jgi:urease accessory protein
LILYGEHVQEVQQQCQVVSDALLRLYTRVRERPGERHHDDLALEHDDTSSISTNTTTAEFSLKDLGLARRVCMGISPIDLPLLESQAHVVRLAATNNEDLYRIFHHCLLPLHTQFGMEFYKERIRAKASEIPRADQQVAGSNQQRCSNQALIVSIHEPSVPSESSKIQESMNTGPDTLEHSWLDQKACTGENSSALWSEFMLADSALPTGSFAHSAGIEVAAQMQMIQSPEQLETFIQAATRSTIQVVAPFLVAGHEWAGKWNGESDFQLNIDAAVEEWKRLQQKANAVLSSNAPACAASLDQGKSLARVGHQWLGNDANPKHNHDHLLLKCFDQHGHHLGPVLGALSSRLGLTTDQVGRLLGYCIARDMVSAAVRLSLVGPLASIKVLRNVQNAADEAWQVLKRHQDYPGGRDPIVTAAASAPVLEAIHPCHESLQVRLFRT